MNKSPTFLKIFNEFKAGLKLASDVSQLVERYECFLECLSCDAGPPHDVYNRLSADWNDIKKQCEESK